MTKYGCPYKRDYGAGIESCKVTNEYVTGFVMCECDWESCADYQRRRQETKEMQELFQRNAPKRMPNEPEWLYITRCDAYWDSVPDDIYDY